MASYRDTNVGEQAGLQIAAQSLSLAELHHLCRDVAFVACALLTAGELVLDSLTDECSCAVLADERLDAIKHLDRQANRGRSNSKWRASHTAAIIRYRFTIQQE